MLVIAARTRASSPLKFQKRIARERLNAAVQAIPVDGDHHQLAGVFRRAMEASSL